VLLCGLHAAFGFWAPIVLSVAMALVISHVLFAMVRQISGRTTLAVGIAIIGIVAIAPMLYGRSMLFTVVFAALEVHLLVRATVLGERTALWFVPLVFVLWANVHIHFLYGLFVYGCFCARPGSTRCASAAIRREPTRVEPRDAGQRGRRGVSPRDARESLPRADLRSDRPLSVQVPLIYRTCRSSARRASRAFRRG
jgi:hypothetical protein